MWAEGDVENKKLLNMKKQRKIKVIWIFLLGEMVAQMGQSFREARLD